jgi:hypothetical protein
MRAIGRIIWLPFAFLLALLATLFVVVTLGHELVIHGTVGRQPDEAVIYAALDLVRLVLSFASGVSLLPALLLVIAGEAARIRGLLYYVVGGGAALAVVPLLWRMSAPSGTLDVSTSAFQVLAIGGFAGGFVYWLLAGRNA